jgi:hypothetical protein
MTDFIAKARQNRITALTSHTNGSAMFFPDDYSLGLDEAPSRVAMGGAKTMFVRSRAIQTSVAIDTPSNEIVANDVASNASLDVFVLTEELAISKVMRLAA